MNAQRILQVSITAAAAASIAVVCTGVANAGTHYLTPPASKSACEAVLVSFKYPPSVTVIPENIDEVRTTATFTTYACVKLGDGRYSVAQVTAAT
jgi:hypothetical protein